MKEMLELKKPLESYQEVDSLEEYFHPRIAQAIKDLIFFQLCVSITYKKEYIIYLGGGDYEDYYVISEIK